MQRTTRRAPSVWPLAALTASCATYRPAPLEPLQVLADLEAVAWSPEVPASATPSGTGVGPRELASFAVSTHPRLAAARAEVGVRRALLVEAGLLPDPRLGWDAMDVLASEIVNGTSSSVDVLAGLGLRIRSCGRGSAPHASARRSGAPKRPGATSSRPSGR